MVKGQIISEAWVKKTNSENMFSSSKCIINNQSLHASWQFLFAPSSWLAFGYSFEIDHYNGGRREKKSCDSSQERVGCWSVNSKLRVLSATHGPCRSLTCEGSGNKPRTFELVPKFHSMTTHYFFYQVPAHPLWYQLILSWDAN